MLPLSFSTAGQEVLIARIGGNPEMKKHLEDLGFTVGTPLQVISAPGNGNMIVRIRDSRLAITEQMAQKITVR